MGPDCDPAIRNLIGVIGKVGLEIGGKVIKCRAEGHEAAKIFGGKPVNPVNAIPGGMSKGLNAEERERLEQIVTDMVEFAKFTLQLFEDVVLKNKQYVDLILSDIYHAQDVLDGPGGREEPRQLLPRQGARRRPRRQGAGASTSRATT